MYISFVILALAALASSFPSPPKETSPPTVFNPDGTPADGSLAQPTSKPSKSKSGKWKGPPEKYFHESTFDAHYDGRFASKIYPPDERNTHLRALLRTYLATMHSLGAETWLMHGSLLGWWWNQRIMPWDSDIDVQVSLPALSFLAEHHNMTVHGFRDVAWLGDVNISAHDAGVVSMRREEENGYGDGKREYLLEVNPHWKNGSYTDKHNVIDARWIDMRTGLYIDITTVRPNASSPVRGSLFCKDRHHYLTRQIFPLRTSFFEGVPAKVPYAYQELLAEEYGEASLVQRVYDRERYWFDAEKMEWVRNRYEAVKGEFRHFDSYEEQREKARKQKSGKSKDKGKSGDHLKLRKGGRTQRPRENGEGLASVIWQLFVGV